ncbi:MAG TPA: tetratricopeptide repeat protein, partial [Candidatus Eisenbacteria bacterium]|nr:tetratricopeptide repeat protein [Candidatus Eisenbacteria bacterium]
RWVEAAALHAELTRLEPWNPEHFNNLGTMYTQVGYYDQATRALETAVALDPTYQVAQDNLEGLRSRGLAPGAPAGADPLRVMQERILDRLRSGNFPEARAELDSAYTRFGRDRFELHFLDGTLRLLTGDPVGSIPLLESAVTHMPGNVPVLANLGTAYASAGRLEDARRIFMDALRIQPANLQIQQSLKGLETTLDSLHQSGR